MQALFYSRLIGARASVGRIEIGRPHACILLNVARANDVEKTGSKGVQYEHFAAVARALGSGRRLELLELLAQGERSVEELTELAGLAAANASQHLHQPCIILKQSPGSSVLSEWQIKTWHLRHAGK